MRNDMAKVIVERPRVGGDKRVGLKGNNKRLQRLGDDAPAFESMKSRWHSRKKLNENLSPLKRFLRSRVGQRWDDVFSEICKNITLGSAVQKHVRDHVMDYVATDVQMIDGKPHDSKGREIWFELVYVHPDTGILVAMPPRKKYRWSGKRTKFEQQQVNRLTKYVKVDGLWYEIGFKDLPKVLAPDSVPETDVILKQYAYPSPGGWRCDFTREWGAPIFAVTKQQLNSREIKRLRASRKAAEERQTN